MWGPTNSKQAMSIEQFYLFPWLLSFDVIAAAQIIFGETFGKPNHQMKRGLQCERDSLF